MAEVEEWLDLVDENDQVIGKAPRSVAANAGNVRVINGFLRNSKGELWIPRRSATKKAFPSCLDMGVAGYVSSGDTYDSTFKKESQEELNINTDEYPHKLLGYLTPKDGVSCFMNVYEIEMDEEPPYNKEDFSESMWLTPKDLLKRIEDGDKPKGDLVALIKRFYLSSGALM